MLEVRNVSIYLKKDNRAIVEELSFTLRRGDRAVIIGEEGNGKSTLLKYIYNKELLRDYCECRGEIVTRCRMAYLPQTAEDTLNAQTLGAYFADAPYYEHLPALAQMGLSPDFLLSDQRIGTLSGGERVKIQLARLLMDEPDIWLLDEPTNDLDIETLEWLEDFILRAKAPVLYISHDETLIENTANMIVHLEQLGGKRRCRVSITHAAYREYLSFRRSSFDHQQQVADKQREDYDKQMEKWRQIHNRVEHEQASVSRQNPAAARLLKKKMHSVLALGRRFEREKEAFLAFPQEEEAILAKFSPAIRLPAGKVILDFTLDTLRAGERVLARDVQLSVHGGEHVGIVGRNGTGKSTLLALMWAQLRDRRDIVPCYMPQNYAELLDFDRTPVDYLAESGAKELITRARTYMGSMRFTREEMTGRIGNLSGGQRAKLLYLNMVLKNADVLVLDEPTRNFSALSCPVVRAALSDFGGAILSVSHDRKYLNTVCDKVYELTQAGLRLL